MIEDKERAKRLNEVYRYLYANKGVSSQTMFASQIGLQRSALSAAINGNKLYLTNNLFMKVCAAYPDTFSLDYLLTGEGSLLLNPENEKPEPNVSINDKLIGMLKSQLDLLREQLQAKDRHIEKLLDELRELRHANNQYKIHEHDNDILNFTSEDP